MPCSFNLSLYDFLSIPFIVFVIYLYTLFIFFTAFLKCRAQNHTQYSRWGLICWVEWHYHLLCHIFNIPVDVVDVHISKEQICEGLMHSAVIYLWITPANWKWIRYASPSEPSSKLSLTASCPLPILQQVYGSIFLLNTCQLIISPFLPSFLPPEKALGSFLLLKILT